MAIVKVQIRIPSSYSLKEKRSVIHSLLSKMNKFTSFSASEVGGQELLNMAELGFASVGNEYSHMVHQIDLLLQRLESNPSIEILATEEEIEKF